MAAAAFTGICFSKFDLVAVLLGGLGGVGCAALLPRSMIDTTRPGEST
jgi:hypothetical protein